MTKYRIKNTLKNRELILIHTLRVRESEGGIAVSSAPTVAAGAESSWSQGTRSQEAKR